MKRFFSWILMLAGVGVLLYPTLQTHYFNYRQDKLISSWEESFLVVDSIETDTEISLEFSVEEEHITILSDLESITVIQSDMNTTHETPDSDHETPTSTDSEVVIDEPGDNRISQKAAEKAAYIEANMEGILIIDKIDFKQPIIRGATAENMLLTITSFDSDAYPGEIGNYAIIGHRNLTYGRNFNRLGEIEVGDEIDVLTENGTFVYRVTEVFLVLPDDVGVLFGTKLEKRITLITCDPIGNPTHRLIVRGKLVE